MENKNIKCCVYTRDFYESPYIYFFIEHYIKIGFDKIIILKTNDYDYKYDLKYNEYIEVHKVKNLANDTLQKNINLIKDSDYDWVLVVDVDELLLINKKYNNINSFINDKLSKNEYINTFFFRWGVIEKYNNLFSEHINFNYIFNYYSIYHNDHIKSMVKVSDLKTIFHPHLCELKTKNVIYFENNIIGSNRYSAQQEITDNSYTETILIHIHTRSVNNIIIKSLSTLLKKKYIKDKNNFKKLIEDYKNYDSKQKLISQFRNIIGPKAGLPFHHTKKNKINEKILENFLIFQYIYPIINESRENEILKYELTKININYNNYKEFIKNINWVFE